VTTRRGRLRPLLFFAIGLSAGALATLAYELHVFQRLELTTVDTRFSIRGDTARPTDVVVVGIDDVTFQETGLRWPFPRSVDAKVIDRLTAAGAKVIAEDIQYTEATPPMQGCGRACERLAEDQDAALAEAVYNAGQRGTKVVLATTEVAADGSTYVLGGNARVLGARVGNGSYIPDADGVIRRFRYQIDRLETFPVVAAERALGHTLDPSRFPEERPWIDFAPPETVPFLSYSHVLSGKFKPAVVRGRTVVVGGTAPSLRDYHATSSSGEGVITGPEVQANAIHTVLHGFPLRSGPSWLNLLAIWILALTPPLLGLRLSAVWTIAGSAVLGWIYAVATQVAFERGTILAFVHPVGALVLSTVGGLVAYYLLAAFDRQRTRDTFARFVPEDVVDQVLAQTGGELRLGGVRVVGTCMFADLRGSTMFAESLPPETVVDVINRYLSELTEAILGHGGTLISYLGDGFMAVFGAPIPQEDHADRALAAAREILGERLPRFNEWLRDQGYGDDFTIGIGINTGPFMAGNVGSERRLEYTAMGDTINTASRLEGSTKESGFYALIADSTREALVEPVGDDLVAVGEVDVRGRQEKISVWSIDAARKPRGTASAAALGASGPGPS
jgi:adenylate cyclase